MATMHERTVDLRAKSKPLSGFPPAFMLGVGAVVSVMLILDYGFETSQQIQTLLHFLALALAVIYVVEGTLLLMRAPNRWEALCQRKAEFGLLTVFVLLSVGLFSSQDYTARAVQFLHHSSTQPLAFAWVKLFLLANLLTQLLRLQQRMLARDIRPEWILCGSFALLIVAGTLLLLLPRSSALPDKPISLLDAFFTSTSAACVTGLTVRDTGTEFSKFGQVIILALIQVGGLGIMTFVAFLALTSSQSLSLSHLLAFKHIVNARNLAGLKRQVWAIFLTTFLIEVIGACLLFVFLPSDLDPLHRFGWSVFHSISAFCNAGFALQSSSLIDYQAHPGMMLTFMGLIMVGGFGFLVANELFKIQLSRLPGIRRLPWMHRFNLGHPVYRLPVQTRLSLIVTIGLILLGLVGVWFMERDHLLRGKPLVSQLWIAAFQSVTARTAGFNTIETGHLQPATLLLVVGLMIVGACPVSTGGGIKTVTLAVLLLALRTLFTGRERAEVYGRTLPQKVVIAALGVFVLYMMAAGLCLFGLALCDPQMPLRGQLFEVISALSTVGLSTGITPQLSVGSKLILCVAMFIGRVGPISLVLAVLRTGHPTRYQYPEEELVVG
jgi:trk system potassium uptake protein